MTNSTASDDQSSNSVIYSFFSKWEEPLRQGRVKVFFRKRLPSRPPKRVYFYIGAPVMAIIGSAKVSKIERISAKQALSLADRGCISDLELKKYLGDRDSVGAIHMQNFEFFDRPVSVADISREMVFSPPQNFQNIDADDEAVLRELAR